MNNYSIENIRKQIIGNDIKSTTNRKTGEKVASNSRKETYDHNQWHH